MKKRVKLFALFLMVVFHTACGQNQTTVPQDNIKSETKDKVTSP
jgi:outer membrane lipopolysaccharide assembly protein LptE/RlpB